jgi:glycosyltransferase involved in cell wall biosynthesis
MDTPTDFPVTVVIPALNESETIGALLDRLREAQPLAEILVVDDGSSDATAERARAHGARVVSHPYPTGNGAAIKTGARAARGEILVFMDADGQHDPADISRLLDKLAHGYDMAVGARVRGSQASRARAFANAIYNRFASIIIKHRVQDLTSGFRAVRARLFRRYLYLLPNGFSYPTTITMAFFRSGYPVGYVPIRAGRRQGQRQSHIRVFADGARFLLIMFKVATLYSPLRIFFPVSLGFFVLGLGYYAYTYFTMLRFTNMSALLLSASVVVFMMGLVSEQLTALSFRDSDAANR